MGVVPPPFRDHAHCIRTTVPCPPGHDIGQLADLMLERESASWLMVAAAGAGTMGVWRSVSSWTGPSLQPAVFGSSALPGRIPGLARGRKSASPAGWDCCGRCMR